MDSLPPASIAPGAVFHHYRVLRLLGAGGMAVVYDAVHTVRATRVALKLLHPALAVRPDARARFLREGEAACRIRHPHVITVSEAGVCDGVPYLVMERLEGEDLGQWLAREGALPVANAIEIVLAVAAGVDAAHQAGVVHRDLKPANVFLARAHDGTRRPVVLDFGVSKLLAPHDGRALTATADAIGTPYYMAPEQVHGEPVDARCDQYALGVLLYELLTGRGPFDEAPLCVLYAAIARGDCAPPSAHRPTLPLALERAVLRAMRVEPAERFDSVAGFARALLPLASEPVRARWAPSFGVKDPGARARTPSHDSPRPRRARAALPLSPLRLLGVAAVVATALATAWSAQQRDASGRGSSMPPECYRSAR